MLLIDYNKTFFIQIINYNISSIEFEEIKDFFKQILLYYDFNFKGWSFDDLRIDEIILWLKRRNLEFSISEEAANKILEVQNSYNQETSFYRGKSIDLSILNKDVKLYNYQKQGIEWRLSRQNYADWDDAGLGKSLQNIVVFTQRYKYKEIDSVIIICPNGLGFHWQREILKFVNVFKEEDIGIINNNSKNKPFEENLDKKILIIPSHLIADVLVSYKKTKNKTKSKKRLRWNYVDIREAWKKKSIALVIDESHSIKNPKAIVTKAVTSLKYQFNFRSTLSATPFINRYEDCYSQLNIVDRSIIGLSEKAFRLSIAKSLSSKWGMYNINAYKPKEIKKLLDKFPIWSIKRLKEDLPEMRANKFIKKVYLDLHFIQKEIYEIISNAELQILKEEYDVLLWKSVLNKLPHLTEAIDNPLLLKKRDYNNDYLTRLIDQYKIENDPKFKALKSLLENYVSYQDKKVIIYGHHPETLELLFEKLHDYNPLIIHGSQKHKDKNKYRQDVEDTFNFSDDNKILLLSELTSSAGINLHHKCSNIIIYETPFDATLFRQLQDRTHRIKSINDTIIEILVYPKTVDNIRVSRAMARSNLNDKLNKFISDEELKHLLNGIL